MPEEPLPNDTPVGYVVGGTLKDSLTVRLTVPPQQVQEGSFVVIESDPWQFYGLVTDLQLGATDPRFADEQSEKRLPAGLAKLLHGQTLFTNLEVLPALMLERGPEIDSPDYPAWREAHPQDPQPLPVKTVPSHHAPVRVAHAGDVAEIFGEPGGKNYIVGYTREQGHPVCIDLERFVQRSSGIFGATGTGKSFLTRILLAGLIHYDKTSLLVFDMHNEYAFDDTSETGDKVTGLRTKFGSRVQVVGLGAGASIRGNTPNFNLVLGEKDLRPEDIEMLARELNLKETTPTTLDALLHSFGAANWFSAFKAMRNGAVEHTDEGKTVPASDSVAAWANQTGVNVAAAEGLHSKLGRVFNRPYIMPEPPKNILDDIIQLLDEGKHVVLSFGEFESDLDYLLVTNLLTRRIRETWERRTNAFRTGKAKEPRPLVVVVEEAHKLLNREMAAQTAFSTIAREMRKYYVTLLIIDQRPSQIYDEVMSQLGTRISGWLGDEADIAAVLSGLAGRDSLRGMLARLQPKEEVLLLGWGVKMPLPVRSRRYDPRFWEELIGKEKPSPTIDELTRDLYG
ncbi:MAG: DUF87 domain-containing protein [Chloroflexi bacterium]|nr:MAG: DUF87 domain-containing protein [Chloroflexota bacterium]